MKWFKRRKYRGVSKSPLAKAKEQQAKLDTHLMKVYLDDLKANPTFAREIAREKYGLSSPLMGEEEYSDRSDGFENYRKIRKEIKEEAESEKPSSSTLETLANSEAGVALVKMLGGILKQQQQTQQISRQEQPQITQPEPEKLAQPKSPQEELVASVEQLMSMTPQEAAVNIYHFKDDSKDYRSMVYSYATENDFDSIVEAIPMITTHPGNEFLVPLAGKLDRKWMALVYDELNTLRKKEEAIGQD